MQKAQPPVQNGGCIFFLPAKEYCLTKAIIMEGRFTKDHLTKVRFTEDHLTKVRFTEDHLTEDSRFSVEDRFLQLLRS